MSMSLHRYGSLTRDERRFNDSVQLKARQWYRFVRPVVAVPQENLYDENPQTIQFIWGRFLFSRRLDHDFIFEVKPEKRVYRVALYFKDVSELPRTPLWYRFHLPHLRSWKKPSSQVVPRSFEPGVEYIFPEPVEDFPTLPTMSGIKFDGQEVDRLVSFSWARFCFSLPEIGEHVFQVLVDDQWHYVSLEFNQDEPLPFPRPKIGPDLD